MATISKFFPYHNDADTDMLFEATLNKLELDELIFLLRVFQRNSQAKQVLAKNLKKIINKKLS
ncbi:hypothetical protein PTQ27_00165 [Mannheimia sp. AT1]|uniref:Transcriptional regulator n=1 Tax=Mannheimia cairinae TaxID=3025936 RepID=A0ABT5MPX1_9PAST|nr:hypothetical protein [Mannheimia cairinae]MDD0822893.1 hypothetical protein [Mannheimia cairinae]MDD0826079.1 hypothetical protein [Mannheimia cairinae]